MTLHAQKVGSPGPLPDRQARSTDMDQLDVWYEVIAHSDAIRGRVDNYMLDGAFVIK